MNTLEFGQWSAPVITFIVMMAVIGSKPGNQKATDETALSAFRRAALQCWIMAVVMITNLAGWGWYFKVLAE